MFDVPIGLLDLLCYLLLAFAGYLRLALVVGWLGGACFVRRFDVWFGGCGFGGCWWFACVVGFRRWLVAGSWFGSGFCGSLYVDWCGLTLLFCDFWLVVVLVLGLVLWVFG